MEIKGLRRGVGFGHTRREGNFNGLSSPYSKTLMKVQQVNLDWVGYLDHILLNDCCQLTKAKKPRSLLHISCEYVESLDLSMP